MRDTSPLTCREVSEFLAAYIGEELDEQVRTHFEFHLAICPDCRNYLAQYEATRVLSRAALDTEAAEAGVPEALVQAILKARRPAADRDSAPPRRRR